MPASKVERSIILHSVDAASREQHSSSNTPNKSLSPAQGSSSRKRSPNLVRHNSIGTIMLALTLGTKLDMKKSIVTESKPNMSSENERRDSSQRSSIVVVDDSAADETMHDAIGGDVKALESQDQSSQNVSHSQRFLSLSQSYSSERDSVVSIRVSVASDNDADASQPPPIVSHEQDQQTSQPNDATAQTTNASIPPHDAQPKDQPELPKITVYDLSRYRLPNLLENKLKRLSLREQRLRNPRMPPTRIIIANFSQPQIIKQVKEVNMINRHHKKHGHKHSKTSGGNTGTKKKKQVATSGAGGTMNAGSNTKTNSPASVSFGGSSVHGNVAGGNTRSRHAPDNHRQQYLSVGGPSHGRFGQGQTGALSVRASIAAPSGDTMSGPRLSVPMASPGSAKKRTASVIAIQQTQNSAASSIAARSRLNLSDTKRQSMQSQSNISGDASISVPNTGLLNGRPRSAIQDRTESTAHGNTPDKTIFSIQGPSTASQTSNDTSQRAPSETPSETMSEVARGIHLSPSVSSIESGDSEISSLTGSATSESLRSSFALKTQQPDTNNATESHVEKDQVVLTSMRQSTTHGQMLSPTHAAVRSRVRLQSAKSEARLALDTSLAKGALSDMQDAVQASNIQRRHSIAPGVELSASRNAGRPIQRPTSSRRASNTSGTSLNRLSVSGRTASKAGGLYRESNNDLHNSKNQSSLSSSRTSATAASPSSLRGSKTGLGSSISTNASTSTGDRTSVSETYKSKETSGSGSDSKSGAENAGARRESSATGRKSIRGILRSSMVFKGVAAAAMVAARLKSSDDAASGRAPSAADSVHSATSGSSSGSMSGRMSIRGGARGQRVRISGTSGPEMYLTTRTTRHGGRARRRNHDLDGAQLAEHENAERKRALAECDQIVARFESYHIPIDRKVVEGALVVPEDVYIPPRKIIDYEALLRKRHYGINARRVGAGANGVHAVNTSVANGASSHAAGAAALSSVAHSPQLPPLIRAPANTPRTPSTPAKRGKTMSPGMRKRSPKAINMGSLVVKPVPRMSPEDQEQLMGPSKINSWWTPREFRELKENIKMYRQQRKIERQTRFAEVQQIYKPQARFHEGTRVIASMTSKYGGQNKLGGASEVVASLERLAVEPTSTREFVRQTQAAMRQRAPGLNLPWVVSSGRTTPRPVSTESSIFDVMVHKDAQDASGRTRSSAAASAGQSKTSGSTSAALPARRRAATVSAGPEAAGGARAPWMAAWSGGTRRPMSTASASHADRSSAYASAAARGDDASVKSAWTALAATLPARGAATPSSYVQTQFGNVRTHFL